MADASQGPPDPLDDLRSTLEDIDEVEVHERAGVFDRVHRALVGELNTLEEV